jgi:hypothetical protein
MKFIQRYITVFVVAMILLFLVRGDEGNGLAQAERQTKAGQVFESSLSRGRYALILSLSEYGQWNFPAAVARFATPDVAKKGNVFVSIFPPGVALLLLPLYMGGSVIGFGQLAVSLGLAIIALINVILLKKLASRLGLSEGISWIVALVFLFASSDLSYSVVLSQHQVSLLLLLLGLHLYLNSVSLWSYLSFGVICLLLPLVDVPNVVIFLPLVIAMIWKLLKRLSTPIRLGLVAIVVILGLGAAGFVITRTSVLSALGVGQLLPRVVDVQGAKGVIANTEHTTSILHTFEAEKLPKGIAVLYTSFERGLFVYFPIYILSLLGLVLYRKKKDLLAITLGTVVLTSGIYASFGDVWGGPSFGPRYLLPAIPFLALSLGFAIQKWGTKGWFMVLFMVGVAHSVAVGLLGALGMTILEHGENQLGSASPDFLKAWQSITGGNLGSYIFSSYVQGVSGTVLYAVLLGVILLLIVYNYRSMFGDTGMRILKAFSVCIVILFCGALYALTIRGDYGNPDVYSSKTIITSETSPFESSHERAPYALILSIDHDKKVDLSEPLANFGTPDIGLYKGKFYILFPPGMSLLVYPFYLLGKSYGVAQLATYGSVAVMALACIIFLYKIARDMLSLPRWASILAGLVFAFGTTSWSYAITIYQHIPSTLMILAAIYSAWRYGQKRTRLAGLWGLLVWAAFGIGVFLDYPDAIIMLPIMLYFFFKAFEIHRHDEKISIAFRISAVITSVTFIALIAAHGYYNKVAFGDFKKFGQSFPRYESKTKFEARQQQLAKDATASATLAAPKSTSAISIFKEQRVANGFYELTVASDKGLFYFSPVLILALLGLLTIKGKLKGEHAMILAVIGANIFVYASFSDPWGGWAFGPRYLIPAMSLLALYVSLFVSGLRLKWLRRLIFYILFAVSSSIALVGVLTTNLIPPGVEAPANHSKDNFYKSFDYLDLGKTSNFVYTHFVPKSLTLHDYYMYLYISVLVLVAYIVFIAPFIRGRHEH